MRRRDFSLGLLLAVAPRAARAQEPAKRHRIAILIPAGAVAVISEITSDPLRRRFYQSFFEELRRVGDVEGQNLTIERYSGEGRPEGYADLAREVVGRYPDVIVAQTNPSRAGGPRGHWHNTDRLGRGECGRAWARYELGAPWQQYHRGQSL